MFISMYYPYLTILVDLVSSIPTTNAPEYTSIHNICSCLPVFRQMCEYTLEGKFP